MAAPYASIAEMITAYGEVNLERILGTAIEAGVNASLTSILNDESNRIESYLKARYTVPLSSTPEVITTCCKRLTYYSLWVQFSQAHTAPEDVKKEFDGWITWLEKVRDGEVDLDTETLPTEQTDSLRSTRSLLTQDDMSMTTGKGNSDYNSLGSFGLDGLDEETSD